MKQIVGAAIACAGLIGCAGGPAQQAAADGACARIFSPDARAECEKRSYERQAYMNDLRHRPRFGLQMVAPG